MYAHTFMHTLGVIPTDRVQFMDGTISIWGQAGAALCSVMCHVYVLTYVSVPGFSTVPSIWRRVVWYLN